MRLYKCDKCKKKMDVGDHQSGKVWFEVCDGNHYTCDNPAQFDLCPDCMYEFEELLKSFLRKTKK